MFLLQTHTHTHTQRKILVVCFFSAALNSVFPYFGDCGMPRLTNDDDDRVGRRGTTRSGAHYARANFGYYNSLRELKAHHQRLLEPWSAPSVKYFSVGGRGGGRLLQATLRFAADYPNVLAKLYDHFGPLFEQTPQLRGMGYEVLVTFNPALSN